jgi:VWFA-related protein
MTLPSIARVSGATSIALASVLLGAQAPPAARLTVDSPAEGALVSGVQTLRATVEPTGAANAVVFFVDGRQVCVVTTAPYACDWDAGRAVKEHQVRVVAPLAAGGRVVQSVRTKGLGYSDNVDVDAVQVTVTVSDGRGRYIRGLPRSAFRVFQDDKEQTITHFVSENVPLELIVAIDISGSMAPAMPKLKEAVREFLGAVPTGNQVTLIGFNDTIFTLTKRTTDPADRVKAVDRLASWGATALYDVILRGVGMLGRETGRKALVVFTDGEDEGSHATITDAERALQGSDVTMYMIGEGRAVAKEKDSLRRIMERLSAPSGGRAIFAESIDELRGAFGELIEELSSQYLLGYAPENVKRDGAWHQIRVTVDGYSGVRARQGYRIEAGR